MMLRVIINENNVVICAETVPRFIQLRKRHPTRACNEKTLLLSFTYVQCEKGKMIERNFTVFSGWIFVKNVIRFERISDENNIMTLKSRWRIRFVSLSRTNVTR